MNITYHTHKVYALVKTMPLSLSVQRLEEFINSSAIRPALVSTIYSDLKVLEVIVFTDLNSCGFLIKNRIIHTRPQGALNLNGQEQKHFRYFIHSNRNLIFL